LISIDAAYLCRPSGNARCPEAVMLRLRQPWRHRIFSSMARLVHLRTHSDALAVHDTDFIPVDFSDGKRVRVWRRGQPGTGTTLSLWLIFSDFASANLASGGEYRVQNWPATPAGKH
jgi:hypothetical protein